MTGAISAIVIGTAATAYSIYSAEQQKKKIEEDGKKQDAAQRKLEAEAKQRSQNEEAQTAAVQARNQGASAQRRRAGAARSGTLMTSPLGTLGTNLTDTSSGKSLIGQ